MIEKKTMWAVTRDWEIVKKTVILNDGKLLAAKDEDAKDVFYKGFEFETVKYLDTELEAEKFIGDEENYIRDMIPKVKKFIDKMDSRYELREKLGIKKTDYLGSYGEDRRNYYRDYNKECFYAQKLENFIKSRMLNIDGYMIPVDQVREIKWYAIEDAEEYEPDQWKAVLTTTNGDEYSTCNEEDVRLIWATFGRSTSWYIDNDIDYNKSEDNDE